MLDPSVLRETNKLFQNLFKNQWAAKADKKIPKNTNVFDADKVTEHKPLKKTVAPTNRAMYVDWVKEYAHKIRLKNNAEPAALTPQEANEATRQA